MLPLYGKILCGIYNTKLRIFRSFASPSYSLKASFVSMTTFLKDWMMKKRTHSEMRTLSGRLKDLIPVLVSNEKKLPDCLLTDKVKDCKNYKYYVQALKEDKVGFLDEVILPSFMQKKGKKGSKSGSSGSSTKSEQKPKRVHLSLEFQSRTPFLNLFLNPHLHLLLNHLTQKPNPMKVQFIGKPIHTSTRRKI
jgi:RecG-like helicase